MAQKMNGKDLLSMGASASILLGAQKDQESRKRKLPLKPFLPQRMFLLCCLRHETFGSMTHMALWAASLAFQVLTPGLFKGYIHHIHHIYTMGSASEKSLD